MALPSNILHFPSPLCYNIVSLQYCITIQYCITQYCITQYCITIQYCITQYCITTVLYHSVLYHYSIVSLQYCITTVLYHYSIVSLQYCITTVLYHYCFVVTASVLLPLLGQIGVSLSEPHLIDQVAGVSVCIFIYDRTSFRISTGALQICVHLILANSIILKKHVLTVDCLLYFMINSINLGTTYNLLALATDG